jgi:adenylate cyclase
MLAHAMAAQTSAAIAAHPFERADHRQLTILFTDLVDHADWALRAGDTVAVDLLRTVGQTVERPVVRHGGRVVKRLGDGLMAVFADAGAGVDAALEATAAVRDLEIAGYRPTLRAGLHTGRPRSFGDDYLGVDVNIAARVAGAAGPGEVLVSDSVRPHLDADELALRTRRRFAARGAPRGLKVHAVRRLALVAG